MEAAIRLVGHDSEDMIRMKLVELNLPWNLDPATDKLCDLVQVI